MKYTEFDQEVAEKKAIASSARHRKIGSKSRKCSLPSDYLSKTQKCKLNGEVVTVNLNKPMDFKEFTKASVETQREYIQHLRDELGATKSDIQRMFNISAYQMDTVCKTLAVGPFHKVGKKTIEKTVVWRRFLAGAVSEKPTPDANSNSVPALCNTPSMCVKRGQLTFSGNLQEICCKLQAILGQNVMMNTMEVNFTITEEGGE